MWLSARRRQVRLLPPGPAVLKIPYFKNNDFDKLSIAFWFKRSRSKPTGPQTLISRLGPCGGSAFNIGSKDMETLYVEVKVNSGAMFAALQSTPDQRDWVHIAITYDGSWNDMDTMIVKIYVDGVLKKVNTSLSGRLIKYAGGVSIGVHGCQDGSYFKGYMDTISFTRKVLHPKEVWYLYTCDMGTCFVRR